MAARPAFDRCVALGVLAFALGAFGCSGAEDARGEAALARLQSHPAPAFVRFVNLGDAPINIHEGSRPLAVGVTAGGASAFTSLGVGPHQLKVGDKPLTFEASTGTASTVLSYADGRMETVPAEERHPTDKGNVRVVFAAGDGSTPFPSKGFEIESSSKLHIGAKSNFLKVPTGTCKLAGHEIPIEEKCSYTFFLVPEKRTWRVLLMRNTPELEAAVGRSASS